MEDPVQIIVECPSCLEKVSVVCNTTVSLFEENDRMLRFSLMGMTFHSCL